MALTSYRFGWKGCGHVFLESELEFEFKFDNNLNLSSCIHGMVIELRGRE